MNKGSTEDQAADDVRYMRRALRLAQRGRTHPNPMVGAVVVREGKVVGEGFHPKKGEPHAEAFAFAKAGASAQGATLYVTLEPCAHTDGGRTPCVARCLTAGVARVVVAHTDPDHRVAGRGVEQLGAAGVSVTLGVEEAPARALNRAYIKHRVTGLPYITHQAAMTLDGKVAAPDTGDSRWVTGEAARAFVHRLRDRADAIIAGVGTVLQDDPQLTARLPRGNGRDPLRVIIDSRLRTPPEARVVQAAQTSEMGTVILTVEGADRERRARLEAAGAAVVALPAAAAELPAASGQPAHRWVDVSAVARYLSDRGALSILLEGGGELAASFWEAGLVDRALFFVAPRIIGGRTAKTPVEGTGRAVMGNAIRIRDLRVRRFGQDIALEGEAESAYVYGHH